MCNFEVEGPREQLALPPIKITEQITTSQFIGQFEHGSISASCPFSGPRNGTCHGDGRGQFGRRDQDGLESDLSR